MATVLQDMRERVQRRSTYDCGGTDPAFRVRALGLKGMKITSTDREVSDDAAGELADMWTNQNPPTAWLTISPSSGIRVTDTRHNDVVWYDMNEISHCNVHRDIDTMFVFVGQQHDEIRCHAMLCTDATKCRSICLAMSDAFQKFFNSWQIREETQRCSVMIESPGTCALITDNSRTTTKHYSSEGNLASVVNAAEPEETKRTASVRELFQRFRFAKKPLRSKWAPIPTDEDSDNDNLCSLGD